MKSKWIEWIPYLYIVGLLSLQLGLTLNSNHGIFTYTLDDPYIHLALAENIAKGEYAINIGEPAAPSSSFLWPFLLAPFASTVFFSFVPLLLNLACIFLSVPFWKRIASRLISTDVKEYALKRALAVTACLFLTNSTAMVLTGMEHSLQLLLTVFVVFGIFEEIYTGKLPKLAILGATLAPLVRYESMAITVVVAGFWFLRGHRFYACAILGICFGILAGFSFYLHSLGLGFLPSSILAKSYSASALSLRSFFTNSGYALWKYIVLRPGIGTLLFLLLLVLGSHIYALKKQPGTLYTHREEKARYQLAFMGFACISLHLVFGQYNWSYRYVNYLIALLIPLLWFVFKGYLQRIVWDGEKLRALPGIISLFLMIMLCKNIGESVIFTHIAANNIYQQQYQMRRFLLDYYKGPVGVNDLGLTSLQNHYYVLDFAGLASEKARILRHKQAPHWMRDLVDQKQVGLVMIYDLWFLGEIPTEWDNVAYLTISRSHAFNLGGRVVSFYVTPYGDKEEILKKLRAFRPTLPEEVQLTLESEPEFNTYE